MIYLLLKSMHTSSSIRLFLFQDWLFLIIQKLPIICDDTVSVISFRFGKISRHNVLGCYESFMIIQESAFKLLYHMANKRIIHIDSVVFRWTLICNICSSWFCNSHVDDVATCSIHFQTLVQLESFLASLIHSLANSTLW